MQVSTKSKTKHARQNYTHKLSTSFLKNTNAHEGCENKKIKNNDSSRFFLVKGWLCNKGG